MNIPTRLPVSGTVFVAAALLTVSQLAAPLASADTGQPAYLKDLDVRQVPMAKLEPTPASAASSASTGLSVMTTVTVPTRDTAMVTASSSLSM